MKKTERITLNIVALVLAHIIMAFLSKMSEVHKPYIIISMLFGLVYYFLLVQMIYRNRVVFSKQLFDGGSPWYKQLGIVKILLLFAADKVISIASTFISSFISSFGLIFLPSPDEMFMPNAGVWSYAIIWMNYMVYYLILTGKNAFVRKKTSLLILGVTLVATVVFSVVESSIYTNTMSIENSMTQYVELLNYANTTAAMRHVLKCVIACVIVVFCELGAVGKDVTAQAESETASELVTNLDSDNVPSDEGNEDNANVGGATPLEEDNEDNVSKIDANEDN